MAGIARSGDLASFHVMRARPVSPIKFAGKQLQARLDSDSKKETSSHTRISSLNPLEARLDSDSETQMLSFNFLKVLILLKRGVELVVRHAKYRVFR